MVNLQHGAGDKTAQVGQGGNNSGLDVGLDGSPDYFSADGFNAGATSQFQVNQGNTSENVQQVTYVGSSLVFNNTFDSNINPQYRSAVIAAENFFQSRFSNPVTLNVSFLFQPIVDSNGNGYAFSAQNRYYTMNVSYDTLKNALLGNATTADDQAAVASLPVSDPSGGKGFSLAPGMVNALGLAWPSNFNSTDTISVNSNLSWTFGADVTGAIEHEISEGVMGRIGGLGIQNSAWGPMDLFRYSAPGQPDYTGGADGLPAYFSVDGSTMLLPFHNSMATGHFDGQDFADWNGTVHNDAFGPGGPGAPGFVTSTDLRVLDILGWTPSAPLVPGNFRILDTATNVTTTDDGQAYAGPVNYLQQQYIWAGSDGVNVTAAIPDVFLKSGPGDDALAVNSGSNVLDGGTGSNFLAGASGADGGTDTFFVDGRGGATTWSTAVDFHSGDAITFWGFDGTQSTYSWAANDGAQGYQGATIHAATAGAGTPVNASLTFAGMSLADAQAKLAISTGSVGGESYMYVKSIG